MKKKKKTRLHLWGAVQFRGVSHPQMTKKGRRMLERRGAHRERGGGQWGVLCGVLTPHAFAGVTEKKTAPESKSNPPATMGARVLQDKM